MWAPFLCQLERPGCLSPQAGPGCLHFWGLCASMWGAPEVAVPLCVLGQGGPRRTPTFHCPADTVRSRPPRSLESWAWSAGRCEHGAPQLPREASRGAAVSAGHCPRVTPASQVHRPRTALPKRAGGVEALSARGPLSASLRSSLPRPRVPGLGGLSGGRAQVGSARHPSGRYLFTLGPAPFHPPLRRSPTQVGGSWREAQAYPPCPAGRMISAKATHRLPSGVWGCELGGELCPLPSRARMAPA